ncbi:hypothetical protein DPMN_097337 [Dreissena polymorpha]|uniref:Uncharacterized protein n=1 Tax=Dreissena polymorpha TaxID=45954 RepID=A0A9D4R5C1_DREPO|nr:hypothetical protein DPMN_097337 [Dreissena polymorpha]
MYQIGDKVKAVREVQERLNRIWQDRREHHEQLYDLHIFLRDAQQLRNTCSSQEVTL